MDIRASGNSDQPPVTWMSSDDSMKRIGVINSHLQQYMLVPIGELFASFMTDRARPIHIIDVEFLEIVLGVVLCVASFDGAAVGISDNMDELPRISTRRGWRGVANSENRFAMVSEDEKRIRRAIQSMPS